ncbi:hypothetical protein C8A05DRAFT_39629 [Staphylotrichum tortipilum]|uniref:Uncharacterized protein n=1 Tax=Staphylotrichum tortipilum TaxID=2831512 RepID=A0AAN6M9N8_9PEZI|nr:hypothetical protein C8A05DRAFT_39629 [Staphylotrichum longicolle]
MTSPAPPLETPVYPYTLGADALNISPSTANAMETHLVEVALARDPPDTVPNGTVLAFVTFPKDCKLSFACDGKPWKDVRIRMSYDKLMALGSPTIQDMFSPSSQRRFRRRLGFEKEMPFGIDYILDFTPPLEGSELADLVTKLWLPRVVKLWFLAGQYIPEPVLSDARGIPPRPLADKAVGAILALGHDDVCKGRDCLTAYDQWQTIPNIPGIVGNSTKGKSHIPEWRKIEDYCPIRHRVAVIRVLRAINGESLLLNSAARMWTVAQVAIYLEVPQVVVDPVAQWLVAPPNTKFIEICPERAFQLAYALKIPSVLIAAFKILVNELAIDYASSNPVSRPPLTWAQRRRDDYGDYPSDPVEYASRAYAERMSAQLKILQSDDVFDRLPSPLPEWQRLKYYGTLLSGLPPDNPIVAAYNELVAALLAAFRRWVQTALDLDPLCYGDGVRMESLVDAQRRHYIPLGDRRSMASLYITLSPPQKVLTPAFWDHFSWASSRTDFRALMHNSKSLAWHAGVFNRTFGDAATRGEIPPFNPFHPALADTIEGGYDRRTEFWLASFYHGLYHALGRMCTRALGHETRGGGDAEPGVPFFLSDHHLLALEEETELKYLPIWATGWDDGSGGVFQVAVPEAAVGTAPVEPGPGYHTGFTTAGTDAETDAGTDRGAPTTAPSDFGVGVLSLGNGLSDTGTVGRSLMPGGGTSATANEGNTGATSSATVTDDEEGMYAAARYALPATHQAQGQAIEVYVEELEVAMAGVAVAGGVQEEEEDEMGVLYDSDEEMGFEWTDDGFDEDEELEADEVV